MITTRQDLGKLFTQHYQTGIGVEVGVQNGYNAKQILSQWDGTLYLIDTWPDLSIMHTAKELLEDTNTVFIRDESLSASQLFEDNSLDFVYIDADHSYEAVKKDFNAWYRKVRPGGIISGHDYGVNDCIGVKQFIDEFMKQNLIIEMKFTTDDFWDGKEYQTWWFVKPEIFDSMGIITMQ